MAAADSSTSRSRSSRDRNDRDRSRDRSRDSGGRYIAHVLPLSITLYYRYSLDVGRGHIKINELQA